MYALEIVRQADANFDPADATTYYLGSSLSGFTSVEGDAGAIFIRRAGTVVAASLTVLRRTTGVDPTTEAVTLNIRLNASSDTLVQTVALPAGVAPQVGEFLNSGLSLAVVAGDRLAFSFVTPTWTTNPTLLRLTGYVIIEDTTERATVTSNDSEISANLAAILTNDSDISANLAAIITNDSDISAGAAAILTNDSDISALVAEQLTQDSSISANLAAILTNDSDISAGLAARIANDSDISALVAEQLTQDSSVSANLAAILTNDSDISANLVHATRVS